MKIEKHFVTFYSPGTFVAETTEQPIDAWDVEAARRMAKRIRERHGATPYGFRFTTRSRGDKDLDSKVVKKSPMHYLGGKVETLAEIEARNDPREAILRDNMRGNKWDRVVTTTNGYRWTQPLEKDDIVLPAPPSPGKQAAP